MARLISKKGQGCYFEMASFVKPSSSSGKQAKSSLNEYDHTDSLSYGTLVKETILNNCDFPNARALGVFVVGALFIYFFAQKLGVDDETEMERKLISLGQ